MQAGGCYVLAPEHLPWGSDGWLRTGWGAGGWCGVDQVHTEMAAELLILFVGTGRPSSRHGHVYWGAAASFLKERCRGAAVLMLARVVWAPKGSWVCMEHLC